MGQLRNCEDCPTTVKAVPRSSPVPRFPRPVIRARAWLRTQFAHGLNPSRGWVTNLGVNYLSKQSDPTHRTETVQAAPRTNQGAPASGSTEPFLAAYPIVTEKTQGGRDRVSMSLEPNAELKMFPRYVNLLNRRKRRPLTQKD
jgi:hypothetical protein